MTDSQGQDPKDATASTPVVDEGTTPTSAASDDGGTQAVSTNIGDGGADELRRARDDAAKYRTQLREAQKQLEAAQTDLQAKDDEGKSELQKALDKVGEFEAKFQVADRNSRNLRLQNAVMVEAQKLEIVDPDAAFKLLDVENVEYDGEKPSNIADLLAELIEQRPYLKAPEKPKGQKAPTSSTTQPSGGSGKALTMDDIQSMSPDEVNARWDEVKPVLAASRGR